MNPVWIRRILIGALAGAAVLVLSLVAFVAIAVQGLPSEAQLADYEPPITTRVHAGDGSLIAEFAREQRVFVPIEAIPDVVKQAFLSAEDKKFYEHGGIDFNGLIRATAVNILSIFTGDRMQGASTITQQVAKNMLLTSDRTITRKVKEAFLAQRIERAFSKDRILELYLNEIYLGQRAYGVAAAALNYFDKPLSEVTIAEAAYLAALPKGPNNYHPIKQKERAIERRNYVIGQMLENGYITEGDADAASKADLVVTDRLAGDSYVMSAHFVEELRRQVIALYGEKRLYDEGLSIRSTLDTNMQVAAARALRRGLDSFDRRKGWRGPLEQINLNGDVDAQLADLAEPPGASGWRRAVVTEVGRNTAKVRLEGGGEGVLGREEVAWAASGARRAKDRALKPGSAVFVAPAQKAGQFVLKQTPEVEGAIVAMDANTGRVFAMVGGYSFGKSEYNRVTQARRQPGSAFKPIVYAAALDYGLTPATLVADEPFQMEAGDGTTWNPENYTKETYGPTTLRTGLEKSRNLMTIRLAYEMGMERVAEYATRIGTHDNMPPLLANSLGAGETTLMRLVGAYAEFVNGGKKVEPVLFDRIQNRYGQNVFPKERVCPGCDEPWNGQDPPDLPDTRPQTLDPITAYQITSMLEGALTQRGTGAAAAVPGLALAGKTGTTNDYKDAWFVGFSPNVVVGVWVGYDKPKSMGEGETGGRVSAPIFKEFASATIKPEDAPLFRRPPGIRIVRIDADTGLLPGATTTRVIDEYFRPDTEPVADFVGAQQVIGASAMIDPNALGQLAGVFTNDVSTPAPPADGIEALNPSAPPTAPRPGAPGAPSATAQRPDESLSGTY